MSNMASSNKSITVFLPGVDDILFALTSDERVSLCLESKLY